MWVQEGTGLQWDLSSGWGWCGLVLQSKRGPGRASQVAAGFYLGSELGGKVLVGEKQQEKVGGKGEPGKCTPRAHQGQPVNTAEG